ncbi:MAG: DsbA family protein [Thermomicrobiales bacterium]|nr:DsbA family protein [Thermomicrobiales bacterium]
MSAPNDQELTQPAGPEDHARGPEDAPATIVMYGDYQCPYTRKAVNEVAKLEQHAGGRFRFIFRHFPLRELHPRAQAAAEAAEHAGQHGRFWQMHDQLFAHQDALDDADLAAYATKLGIPAPGADGHYEAGHKYLDRIESDIAGGIRSGVGGTPTIFINGHRHRGGYDQATLQRAIELAR